MIGDVDPEDAYDSGDPPDDQLAVLERVVAALSAGGDRREARRVDALRVVDNLRHALVTRLQHERLARIRADLEALV